MGGEGGFFGEDVCRGEVALRAGLVDEALDAAGDVEFACGGDDGLAECRGVGEAGLRVAVEEALGGEEFLDCEGVDEFEECWGCALAYVAGWERSCGDGEEARGGAAGPSGLGGVLPQDGLHGRALGFGHFGAGHEGRGGLYGGRCAGRGIGLRALHQCDNEPGDAFGGDVDLALLGLIIVQLESHRVVAGQDDEESIGQAEFLAIEDDARAGRDGADV